MSESSQIRAYEADEATVIASKMDLLGDGGAYYYLRKGEAHGAIEVAAYGMQLLQVALDLGIPLHPWLADAAEIAGKIAAGAAVTGAGIASFNKTWEFAVAQLNKFLNNLKETSEITKRIKARLSSQDVRASLPVAPIPRDIRILCNRDEQNVQALPVLQALGARVRHRPQEFPTGSHRYHVNEIRFVLHIRISSERFLGFDGKDEFFRNRLREEFLREWELCGPDVKV